MFDSKIGSKNYEKRRKSKMRKKLDSFCEKRIQLSYNNYNLTRIQQKNLLCNEEYDLLPYFEAHDSQFEYWSKYPYFFRFTRDAGSKNKNKIVLKMNFKNAMFFMSSRERKQFLAWNFAKNMFREMM